MQLLNDKVIMALHIHKMDMEDFAQSLIHRDQKFNDILNQPSNANETIELNEYMENIYQEEIQKARLGLNFEPPSNLNDFIRDYKNDMIASDDNTTTSFNENSCYGITTSIYDPNKGKHIRNSVPVVVGPLPPHHSSTFKLNGNGGGRGRPEEFNVYKFLCDNVQNAFPLSFENEIDGNDEWEDELSYNEKMNLNNQADHNLRKIARLIMVLNQHKGGYKIMDCYSEKRLHRI